MVQAADRLANAATAFDLQAGDPATIIERLDTLLKEVQRAAEPLIERDRATVGDGHQVRHSTDFRDLLKAVRELSWWLDSSPGQTLRRRTYFLSGVAGSGKTHLLLDATRRALVEVEPRLADFEAEVIDVAYHLKSQHQLNPERLYQDAKRYLAVLLGAKRGSAPESRHTKPPAYEARFSTVVEGPSQALPEHEAWLRRQDVLDRCCSRLHDKLDAL